LILTRDPDTRRLAARILLAQATATIGLGALAWSVWGARHGASALSGGAIGLVANVLMTLTALRPVRSPGGALGRLFMGQMVKVGLTVALFVIAARTGKVAWPPFLVAYAATLLAFWIVPVLSAPSAASASGGAKMDDSGTGQGRDI
jgi:F0F1-type ATP synthase assembly protein I